MAEKIVTDIVIGMMDGKAPLTGPVVVSVVFSCATKRRTDGDNLLKLITDAMNKVVFEDDSQIEEFHCRVIRGVGKANARSVVEVSALSAD